jgi:hypothetical protein
MSREALREGWTRAWQRFYSPSSIWKRWTVRQKSSWIQTLGYLPLNLMQNRLAKHKIAAGTQRFRSARDFDPMSQVLSAMASEVGPLHPPRESPEAPRRLRVVGE